MKRIIILLAALATLYSCGTTHLTSLNEEDGVVDLGYYKESKKHSSGATSRLNAEDENNFAYNNMYEYLQGRVAGVVINGDPSSGNCSITIRGDKYIFVGSNEPLILLDGQVITDLMTVDPKMVSSVEVLKDAASTAAYGSRGANGVILIRTKYKK